MGEALLPGSDGVAAQGKGGGDGKPENAKEWLRNKLKALASFLGKLGAKAASGVLRPGSLTKIVILVLNGNVSLDSF